MIANDTGFAREICGETAWYYDYNDPLSLAKVIEGVMLGECKPIARESRVLCGQKYSFQKEFEETLKCLKALH